HVLCELVDDAFVDEAKRGNGVHAGAGAGAAAAAKAYALPELLELRGRWRDAGKTVVWTNGVFDVLHVGHLTSLRAARGFGDVLIVGVNADAAVTAQKGPRRPIFPAGERVEMLAALDVVDAVIVFEQPTPVEMLAALRPDVHVKGA